MPISPCPSHKHRHDFDGQTNKHIASWNVSASGVVPPWMKMVGLMNGVGCQSNESTCRPWMNGMGWAKDGKQLDAWDEWREDIGWQNRSAAVVDLDDLIDAVFDGFESMGVLDNTFVFFSSECARLHADDTRLLSLP